MRFSVLAAFLLGVPFASAEPLRFDLRTVATDATYTPERGHGFDLGTGPGEGRPFYFSVCVPEGNYRVTLSLGGDAASETTVKAESRRLMLERVTTAPGEHMTRSFLVNVRTPALEPPPRNAPGGDAVRINDRERGVLHWDDKLTLEFNGSAPVVSAIEVERVEDAITVFLAGDSTVTDQPGEPAASWGQMLPRFFDEKVAVANHAESGETMKSFITALRLDKLLSQMKRGDWLFLQFGHNDSKSQWPQTYVEPFTTYKTYLKVFIAEARRRGATPVLVTSPHRRVFDDQGRIKNTHGDYPAAVREVAREENVALIDLHTMSAQLYEALGPQVAPRAFNDDGRDATHHNNYGAYELARCVVEGIRQGVPDLAAHVSADVAPFDPARPDRVDAFVLPASPARATARPRGN